MRQSSAAYSRNRGHLALTLLLWLIASSFCVVSSRLHAESLPAKATSHSCCPHDESSKTSSGCEGSICSQSLLKIDDHKLLNAVVDPQSVANLLLPISFILTLSLTESRNIALQSAFDEPVPHHLLTRTTQTSPNAPPRFVTHFI